MAIGKFQEEYKVPAHHAGPTTFAFLAHAGFFKTDGLGGT
jgi:hypothetical protein